MSGGPTGYSSNQADFNALSPQTTKGDLISRSSTVAIRVAVGTDNQVLTADSSQSSGVKWSAGTNWTTSSKINNLGLAASVAASAMTIALKQSDGTDPSAGGPVVIGFRNATSATGQYAEVSATGAISTVISSGSTAGSSSGFDNWVYVYAINNSGTIELAWSGSKFADDGSVVTTTAEGGAGAADSKSVLYSTTARSNVACRLIGRIKSNQVTAGTWASAPSEITLWPFEIAATRSMVTVDTGNGVGGTNTTILRFVNIRQNIGTDITYSDSAAAGGKFIVNTDGIYSIMLHMKDSTNTAKIGITINDTALTTQVEAITYAQGLRALSDTAQTTGAPFCSFTGVLNAGDVIRAHGIVSAAPSADANTMMTVCKISQ